MASDDESIVFIKENPDVEYVEDTPYVRHILDIPEIEIAEDSTGKEQEADETEYNQESFVREEYMEVTESDETEETWDKNKVKRLLNLYLENIDNFCNPKIKKRDLWKKIGAIIGRDADACDSKYRNLKQHYVSLLRKKRHLGRSHIGWPFFNLFQEIGSRCGFNLNETVRYRPIAMKPQWGSPQYVMVSNPPVKNPVIINAPASASNNFSNISFCDPPNMRPQKRKMLEEFQSVSEELRSRQYNIESKLDCLVDLVRESNNIQRERNKLFQDYLRRVNK